jgi:hypothetical protein
VRAKPTSFKTAKEPPERKGKSGSGNDCKLKLAQAHQATLEAEGKETEDKHGNILEEDQDQ